jgi:hypothetical protein
MQEIVCTATVANSHSHCHASTLNTREKDPAQSQMQRRGRGKTAAVCPAIERSKVTIFHKYKLIVPMLGLLALSACARTKNISTDELRSKVLSAISVASETELLIDQIENGHITEQFQIGHSSYLRKEAAELSQELGQAQTDSADADKLHICSEQLNLLVRELTALKLQSDDEAAVAASRKRVKAIRTSLETAKAGL